MGGGWWGGASGRGRIHCHGCGGRRGRPEDRPAQPTDGGTVVTSTSRSPGGPAHPMQLMPTGGHEAAVCRSDVSKADDTVRGGRRRRRGKLRRRVVRASLLTGFVQRGRGGGTEGRNRVCTWSARHMGRSHQVRWGLVRACLWLGDWRPGVGESSVRERGRRSGISWGAHGYRARQQGWGGLQRVMRGRRARQGRWWQHGRGCRQHIWGGGGLGQQQRGGQQRLGGWQRLSGG